MVGVLSVVHNERVHVGLNLSIYLGFWPGRICGKGRRCASRIYLNIWELGGGGGQSSWAALSVVRLAFIGCLFWIRPSPGPVSRVQL